MEFLKQFKTAIRLLLLMTILTGLVYPLFVTSIAQLFFPAAANGSLIKRHEQIIGSKLIGQSFTDERYFWSRPSATQPFPYNAANSSGSNFSAMNPQFLAAVKDRIATLQQSDPEQHKLIPVELVTTSGSGLDPEISPHAAHYQAPRIAKVRHLPEKTVRDLIQRSIEPRFLGLLGEPRVNVLQLNLALDNLTHPNL